VVICIFKVRERNNACPLCRKPLSKKRPNIIRQNSIHYAGQPPIHTQHHHHHMHTLPHPHSRAEIPMRLLNPRSRSPSPFPDIHDVYRAGLLDNENIINENTHSLINDGIFINSIVNNITTITRPTESITISVARNLEEAFTYMTDDDNEY
jgi:hypothetical protein